MLTKDARGRREPEGTERDISDRYSIRHVRDNIKIRSPENKAATISSHNTSFIAALSAFSPLGTPSLTPDTLMELVIKETGVNIEFPASEIVDVATLVSTFGIGDRVEPEVTSEPPHLPDAMFEPPRKSSVEIPSWITDNPEFKPHLVVDDGDLTLEFTPLHMNQKSKYRVDGRAEQGSGDAWGYEVSAMGKPFGWIVLLDPQCVLVTGVDDNKHTKHRTITSAMFRLSTYKQAAEETA